MLNIIDRALADAAAAAREQTEQLLNELNSAGECMLSAKLIFEREMTEARKLHELADRKQAEAIRNFDGSLIQLHAIIVHLKRQISDGEIVSGMVTASAPESLPPPSVPESMPPETSEVLEQPPEDLPGTDAEVPTEPPSGGLERLKGMAKGVKGGARVAA